MTEGKWLSCIAERDGTIKRLRERVAKLERQLAECENGMNKEVMNDAQS